MLRPTSATTSVPALAQASVLTKEDLALMRTGISIWGLLGLEEIWERNFFKSCPWIEEKFLTRGLWIN